MRFIDNVQMVYFTVPQPEPLDAMAVWKLLYADGGPDEFKRISGNPGKQTVASSVKDGEQVTIMSQIGRIDVTINAVPEGPGTPPYLDNASESLAFLKKKVELLGSVGPLMRGAFALNQLLPIDGEPKSMIEERTGVKFPARSIDPMLQYNIQAEETRGGSFLVNQLSSWSVVNVQLVQIDQSGTNPFSVRTDQHLNHKVDINTVPNQPLAGIDVGSIFDSLARRAADRIANPVSGSND